MLQYVVNVVIKSNKGVSQGGSLQETAKTENRDSRKKEKPARSHSRPLCIIIEGGEIGG